MTSLDTLFAADTAPTSGPLVYSKRRDHSVKSFPTAPAAASFNPQHHFASSEIIKGPLLSSKNDASSGNNVVLDAVEDRYTSGSSVYSNADSAAIKRGYNSAFPRPGARPGDSLMVNNSVNSVSNDGLSSAGDAYGASGGSQALSSSNEGDFSENSSDPDDAHHPNRRRTSNGVPVSRSNSNSSNDGSGSEEHFSNDLASFATTARFVNQSPFAQSSAQVRKVRATENLLQYEKW
jgi:hypothetical protein